MAWLYKKKNSPYWWCGYRASSGAVARESTKILIGSSTNLRKARAHAAQRSVEENTKPSARNEGKFAGWVDAFIAGRYTNARTCDRMQGCWLTLQSFLAENKLTHPAQVSRAHCFQYIEWRRGVGHLNAFQKKGKPIAHNTARLELKVLSLLLREAVSRGYIAFNPALQLGIGKQTPAIKDEMSDWHITTIREEITKLREDPTTKERGDFLYISFEVALHQLCRLAETSFDLNRINWDTGQIQLVTKGGKLHTAAINPNLRPILEPLAKRQKKTWETAPERASLVWFKFFYKLRAKHPGKFDRISFHSTRVTGISRLERAGVPESVVMSQVAHSTSSPTVHRIYRRVNPSELTKFWHAVTPELPPEALSASAPAPDKHDDESKV